MKSGELLVASGEFPGVRPVSFGVRKFISAFLVLVSLMTRMTFE